MWTWTFNQSLFLGGEGSENIGEGGASDKMLKKGEAVVEKTPFGELTQRLVAGLIEDNLMTSGNPFSLNLWLFTKYHYWFECNSEMIEWNYYELQTYIMGCLWNPKWRIHYGLHILWSPSLHCR